MKISTQLRLLVLPFLAAVSLLATATFASPPPPPSHPIEVTFLTHPHANYLDRNAGYTVRMQMWYKGQLFYDGSSAYGKNFPDGKSSFSVQAGGEIKTTLSLLDASGKVLTSQTKTYSSGFTGGTGWTAGQIFTPDHKHEMHWNNGFNSEYAGLMRLQFKIESTDY